ncbi:MAG: dTDP-4-amino-4,6-dideoxygalactose transaminase [Dehalococcoidia bacterium]
MQVPFNVPMVTGKELQYVREAINNRLLSGDGPFTKRCHAWLENNTGCKKALLTLSCTHALEMSAILAGIRPGDEVIMPSFTFVSTANAFALRGAQIVFVDIRPDTMNIDENLIEAAVTNKTRVIVPVHYSGVGCEMDTIMQIAGKYKLLVVEDAAQAIMCSYKDRLLGTIGNLGCYSFHETKDITCGEGGALLINDNQFKEKADIISRKGTDRSKFILGQVDKYTWQDIGSSYLPSELNAAFLLAQLEESDRIIKGRIKSWEYYYARLLQLKEDGLIELPFIPQECRHNGHLFFIKVKDISIRKELMLYLLERGINSVFHYVPLHSSKGGARYGRFHGADKWTTRESEKLLRLPLYYGIKRRELDWVISATYEYFKVKPSTHNINNF